LELIILLLFPWVENLLKFSLLNVLVIVRGYKTVVKFFPHEAQDLERVLSVFTAVKAQVAQGGEDPCPPHAPPPHTCMHQPCNSSNHIEKRRPSLEDFDP